MSKFEHEQLLNEFKTMQSLIYSKVFENVVRTTRDRDLVMFIGNTRSGKSTLVNCVIGNQLKAKKKANYIFNKTHFITTCFPNNGPVIGEGSLSETTVPSLWSSKNKKDTIVDAPGFSDNRGPARDVSNAFYIKEMIRSARSIKFVLVSDINDILGDNINPFISFVDKVRDILPDCDNFNKGMAMVFNKSPDNAEKEDICSLLIEKIIQVSNIRAKNRKLVEYVVQNKNQIVVVKSPTAEGEIRDESIFGDITSTIEKEVTALQNDDLNTVIPGISDKSKTFLYLSYEHLTELKEIDNVLLRVDKAFMDKIETYFITANATKEEIESTEEHFVDMKNKLEFIIRDTEKPLEEMFQDLNREFDDIPEFKSICEVNLKIEFVTFIATILQLKENSIFSLKGKKCISDIINKINRRLTDTQLKTTQISAEEAKIRIKEIEEKQQADHIEYLNKLNQMKDEQIQKLEEQLKIEREKKQCCVM